MNLAAGSAVACALVQTAQPNGDQSAGGGASVVLVHGCTFTAPLRCTTRQAASRPSEAWSPSAASLGAAAASGLEQRFFTRQWGRARTTCRSLFFML